MKSQELASLAGVTSQWLNKLLDRTGVPGVRRRENGRLEIFDEEKAASWAASRAKPKKRTCRRRKTDFWQDFIKRGRTVGSRNARDAIYAAYLATTFRFRVRADDPLVGWSVAKMSKESRISKQGIYQAIARLEKPFPGIRARLLFKYDRL